MRLIWIVLPLLLATACASVDVPDGRTTSVPTVKSPDERYEGLNEKQDPITRVHLGSDVLVPQPLKEDPLPDVNVGPYELRNETLANTLQLILDEYDVSLAFETDDGLKKRITVSNLHGKLKDVVHKVCAVADLYCHFENGTLTVKKTETFVVDLPPINTVAAAASSGSTTSSSGSTGVSSTGTTGTSGTTSNSSSSGSSSTGGAATTNDAYTQISAGLSAVLAMGDPAGAAADKPVIDTSTRVLIYSATQRSNKAATQYFSRLRKNTALIIFETHIWEVTLNNDNATGINWSALSSTMGNLNIKSAVASALPKLLPGGAAPITITPSWTGGSGFSATAVLTFLSEHGAVKTISQPQITVLSGSQASLSVSQQDNYVSGSTTTGLGQPNVAPSTTITTGTTTTGLNVNVTSAWDQSTVYGAINITLNDLVRIDTFSSPDDSSSVQLPHTTSRSLATEIRVRPGDSILIGGLVSQTDALTGSGPGFLTPLFSTSRTTNKVNTELVFLLRPRVVAFVMGDESDTPAIADAPKDGILPAEPAVYKASALGVRGAPGQTIEKGKATLPAGISPEAFAPQSAPAPQTLPVGLQNQAPPSGSSRREKSADDYGGTNK